MGAREGAWRPDVLGDGFEARTLALPDGAEVTLVRHTPSVGDPPARVAVLYVHGFVDYFFHRHVAEAFAERGYAFYAVDLRGHGRSLSAHLDAGGDPNLVDDLARYARDLDAAAAAVRGAGHETLAVLGHSTGGLVASLWADARPGRADALVLNSPWLELNKGWLERVPLTWLMEVVGRIAPRLVIGRLGEHYCRALHVEGGGEWDFDLTWKPYEAFPVRAGWFRSVRRAHRRVGRGLDVREPVLVLASDRTGPPGRHPELLTTDSVLRVEHIRERAPRLGTDVTYVEVAGGAHDLALSPAPAREKYLSTVLDWLDDRLGTRWGAVSDSR
ncbi:alpha/beta hydrolase [Isoptericola variabilis]|uniref:Alpha/beta hydrolase fold protein n=1 Tax=Isoptericola variabilis (strain 225) TaxID=743718 RepID=F6FSV7_ISOV2|nr:alpha/beta hydrolase [Isoptericola variabilis]AEG43098.1 alpha/beta hydrolase fold protein [Isoptericola variabilis 225]TWH35025.1 alpha-beta hydrolase superfamily lysophospholipase [Isoptericola variabilis J7]